MPHFTRITISVAPFSNSVLIALSISRFCANQGPVFKENMTDLQSKLLYAQKPPKFTLDRSWNSKVFPQIVFNRKFLLCMYFIKMAKKSRIKTHNFGAMNHQKHFLSRSTDKYWSERFSLERVWERGDFFQWVILDKFSSNKEAQMCR